MMLHIDDKELKDILMQQHKWRQDVIKGPDLIQVANLIKIYGDYDQEHEYYKIKRTYLNGLGSHVQMSIAQIHEKIEEMKKYHMIESVKNEIILYA